MASNLFFSLAQVNALLPLLQALWQNPFPTLHAAKKLQATLDALFTPAQRAALERFRRERDELTARAAQQAGELSQKLRALGAEGA